jgi:predicted small integral membrane protein
VPFPAVLILCAEVSKQFISSIVVGGVSMVNKRHELVVVFGREKILLDISLKQSEGRLTGMGRVRE